MRLTSTHNPVIKYVRSLGRAAVRRDEGVYLAEGVRLLHEALRSEQRATVALYDPEALSRSAEGTALLETLPRWAETAYEVDTRVLSAASQTETPAGALAVLRRPARGDLERQAGARLGVILDGLRDPGNAGTIARTAWAAGAGYLAATPGTVDLYAPKVVRAGMGAHFVLPLYPDLGWTELRAVLPGVTLIAALADGEHSMYELVWPERAALVVGGEAHGLSKEAREAIDRGVRIPMSRGVESLNASVAASILIYDAVRPTRSLSTQRYK